MTALLLYAERRGIDRLKWVAKPLAAAGFVALGALRAGPQAFDRALLVALVLSAAGDVALLGKSEKSFLLGLGAFLLAHLAFAAAFLIRGVSTPGVLFSGVALLPAALGVMVWLRPRLSRRMRPPVALYVAAVSAMAALSIGTVLAHGQPLLALAGVSFYFSDLFVARQRFVKRGFINKVLGLPLYFGAQLCFAWVLSP